MKKILRNKNFSPLLLSFIFLIYPLASQAQESITISGNVKNIPHSGHPQTTVTATFYGSQEVLATTHTGDDGNFTLEIFSTSIPDINMPENKVIPNPFFRNTQLFFTAPKNATYSFILTNINGRVLFKSTKLLHSGQTLEMSIGRLGPAGLYLLQVIGPNDIFSFKLVQLEENNQIKIDIRNSGQVQIKNENNNLLLLQFQSHNHISKDTIISYQSHNNVNVNLAQIPQFRDINVSYLVKNNPMNKNVLGAQINATNDLGDELFSGETNNNGLFNTTFNQAFYPWMGDTIFEGYEIITDLQANNHHPKTIYDLYAENIEREIILEQIKQTQNANIQLNVMNDMMNEAVQGLQVLVYDNNDNFLGEYNNNFSVEREFFEHRGDTLPDYTHLKFIMQAPYHVNDTINKGFAENIEINTTMTQIPQEKTAELNMSITSIPLFYAPTVDVTIKNQENTILETNVVNGEGNVNIDYEKYQNGENILRLIGEQPVTSLTILASNDKHQEQEYNIEFQPIMNLIEQIQQTPEQGTTTIITNLVGNIFGEAPNGVNIVYRNNDNNELLTQGTTTNGTQTANIEYEYWEHNDLYLSTLNQIKQTITKQGIYEEIQQILNNENQATNYTLTQIPEQRNANIQGNVINPSQEPIPNALVEIQDQDETYTTTTTQTNGDFETSMPYTQYTNPENQNERITIPESIHAKITKPEYETTTTAPQTLEDIINFGQITLTPEPQIITFNIQPYIATHKHINQITTEPFKFLIRTTSDNIVHEFTQTGTNPVEIIFTEYTPNEEIKIWHNNPENKFDQTIFFEDPQGYWTNSTIAQNRIVRNWEPGMQMDTTTTTLGHLGNPEWNSHIDAYFPEHRIYSTGPGIYLTFSGDTIMTMLADRGATPQNTIKNWKHQSVPHVDKTIFTYYLDPNNPWDNSTPVPPEQIETAYQITLNIDQHLTSPSGKIRMPINYHFISSQEDAQEFIDRVWDYTHSTWFQLGQPGNAVVLDVPNQRIRRAYASVPLGSSQANVFEEIKESQLASGNAPGNIASSGYTVKWNNEGFRTPNDVGITMIVMGTGLNSWTPVITLNKDTKTFEEYTTTTKKKQNHIKDPFIKDLDVKENKDYILSIEQNQLFDIDENIKYEYK